MQLELHWNDEAGSDSQESIYRINTARNIWIWTDKRRKIELLFINKSV